MPITNMFEAEELIMEKIAPLFPSDMIFNEAESSDLDNETFSDQDRNEDKVGALVLNAGFRTDTMVGNSRNPQQRIKSLWQIVVVCPKAQYKTHGGVKMLEIIQLLKGYRLSKEIGTMQLIDDERGFNRPEYLNDLAYLPMMFTVDTVL